MPEVQAAGLTINDDEQGAGEPLLLIPYTGADHACDALQLPAYTEHFRCISVDLPGSGASSQPAGPYSTRSYADVMAGFLDAIDVDAAHVAGVSLGAAVGMQLAARVPGRVRSLSLHSAWGATDPVLETLVRSWMAPAGSLRTVADTVIPGSSPGASRPRCTPSAPTSSPAWRTSCAAAPPSPSSRSSPSARR